MNDFKVVLITGASSGIGEAAARLFASEGYLVVAAARRLQLLEDLSTQVRVQGGEVKPIQADLTQLEQVRGLVDFCKQTYGRIDILINNAGIGRISWLENLEFFDDIKKQIDVNLLGGIYLTRLILPMMISQRRGHIINIASIAGLIGAPTYSIYAATKFGMWGFSEALRREVKILGIEVSVIFPASVETEFKIESKINRKSGITSPKFFRLTSNDVAHAILDVVNRPRRYLVLPRVFALLVGFNYLSPALSDLLIDRYFTKKERGL